jgi:hypothetical protein
VRCALATLSDQPAKKRTGETDDPVSRQGRPETSDTGRNRPKRQGPLPASLARKQTDRSGQLRPLALHHVSRRAAGSYRLGMDRTPPSPARLMYFSNADGGRKPPYPIRLGSYSQVWAPSRTSRKASSGEMSMVRYLFRNGSQSKLLKSWIRSCPRHGL